MIHSTGTVITLLARHILRLWLDFHEQFHLHHHISSCSRAVYCVVSLVVRDLLVHRHSIKSDIFGRDANPHILQVIVTEHIQAQVVGHHPLVLCVTHAVRCVADIVAMPFEDYHDYQS